MTGNKGEWSEAYVLLKLLADGKLHAADENLNALPDVFYPIIKILKCEAESQREFILNGNIEVVDGATGKTLFSKPKAIFITESKRLFREIKASKGRSFSIPSAEEFLNSIDIHSLTAVSAETKDIKVVVHDKVTGQTPELGFSIKSLLGKKSTLFNPGAGTNFIFELRKPKGVNFSLDQFNASTYMLKPKLGTRLTRLEQLGFQIRFFKVQSQTLELNLELIDSKLPQILAYFVLERFKTGTASVIDLLAKIRSENPLGYDTSAGHPFYEYKLKSFLVDAALGMTPETVWSGTYDATGGIIIVKATGDLVCYHIYNRNEFEQYLVQHTKLDQPSTSEDGTRPGYAKEGKSKPYKYGWVYEEKGRYFIKLNLQIRFK